MRARKCSFLESKHSYKQQGHSYLTHPSFFVQIILYCGWTFRKEHCDLVPGSQCYRLLLDTRTAMSWQIKRVACLRTIIRKTTITKKQQQRNTVERFK